MKGQRQTPSGKKKPILVRARHVKHRWRENCADDAGPLCTSVPYPGRRRSRLCGIGRRTAGNEWRRESG
jgi:hypothetical protein